MSPRLERFQAKHALGLDPGVDTGSRQENRALGTQRSRYVGGQAGAAPGFDFRKLDQFRNDALKPRSLLVDVLLPGGVSWMMGREAADVFYLSHHRARAAGELDVPVGASQPNDVGNRPV